MATALATGIGEPALVSDVVPGRAQALAKELGGEAVSSNAELAERVDVVFLCHKPGGLAQIAEEIDADAVVSIVGGTAVADVEAAYPGAAVYRFMPNIPAEVREGVLCYVRGGRASEGPEAEILELVGRVGIVIEVPDESMDAATALMGCAPAFYALVVEAMVDAGVRAGLQPADASRMAIETMRGTATVLRETGGDTAGLRGRVTSPGGSTARGTAALERGGIRAAFSDAVDAVVRR